MDPDSNPFLDRRSPPTDDEFQRVLGPTFDTWSKVIEFVTGFSPPTIEWKWYGGGRGWTRKVLIGKRNLFFLSPRPGAFQLGFIFGDRAVEAATAPPLPENLLAELRAARKYAEGRGLRVLVTGPDNLEPVLELIRLKLSH